MLYLRVYNALHEIMIKTMENHYQNGIIIVIKIKIHLKGNGFRAVPQSQSTFANIPFMSSRVPGPGSEIFLFLKSGIV